MEAKELRIGNWVNFAEENVLFQVVEIDSEGLTVENKDDKTWIELDTFESVRITDNILIGFGFEEGSQGYYYKNNLVINVDGDCYFGENECFIKSVHEVHKLQNLFFELNGEELKFI